MHHCDSAHTTGSSNSASPPSFFCLDIALPPDCAPSRLRSSNLCPASAPLRRSWLPSDTAAMVKKPDPSKPTTWTIYKIAAKAVRLGTVGAADEAAAIEKGAAAFKVPANRLMAVRR
jgi:hypothetical protein